MSSYVHQVKAQTPAPHKQLLELNPLRHYTKTQVPAPHEEAVEINHPRPYLKTQIPVPHEQAVDIKPPSNHYVNQIKPQSPEVSDKVIEYYVPIVQDIEEQKVAFNPGEKFSKVNSE